tara:strand:- start:635 stop:2452 length:1818 start_codon:yes stop_codon:yes gene_type:complete
MKQKLIFPKKYASSIEVESAPLCRVSYELINEGSDDQVIKFFITGRAPRNKWKKVGTVRIIVADDDAARFLAENNVAELISDKTHSMENYPTDDSFVTGGQTIKQGNMFTNAPTFENIDTDNERGSLKLELNKITRSNSLNDPDYQDGIKQADFINELRYRHYVDSDNDQWLKPPAYNVQKLSLVGNVDFVRPIISYTYDIVYKSKSKTSRSSSIRYRLDYKASVDRINKLGSGGIRDIIFNPEIKPSGENKKFEVVGTPGSYFTIMLTENIVPDINEFGKSRIGGSHVILKNPLNKKIIASRPASFNPVVTLGDGTEVEAIRDRIPSSGKFVFYHRFDPYIASTSNNFNKHFAISILKSHKCPGTTSTSEARLALDEIGGRKFSNEFSNIDETKWNGGLQKVLDYQGKNRGRLKFSDLQDRHPIDQEEWDTADLVQRYNPILTLCIVTSSSKAVMAQVNGLPTNWPSATSFNVNHPACASFEGRYKDGSGKIYKVIGGTAGVPTQNPWIDMTWKFKSVHSPAQAWSSPTIPKFSSTNASDSNWTNSIPSDNGGMELKIENITVHRKTSSTTNDQLNVSCRVYVINWGTQNVTMNLDISDIATLS